MRQPNELQRVHVIDGISAARITLSAMANVQRLACEAVELEWKSRKLGLWEHEVIWVDIGRKFQIVEWETPLLVREGRDKGEVPFKLQKQIAPEVLKERQTFAHWAKDFKSSSWAEIYKANILGSRFCLEAAIQAGVGRRVSFLDKCV